MDLKIFPVGFSEKEFNDFQAKNIIEKYRVLEDGTVYVFWKDTKKVGRSTIEMIEELDGVIKQAERNIEGSETEKGLCLEQVANLKSEMVKYTPNHNSYKALEQKLYVAESAIRMADDTIKKFTMEIAAYKERVKELSKDL